MNLRYDEDLVEAAVFLCARTPRPDLAPLQVRRFHAERDRLYRLLDPDERNAAFFELHLAWFREWGLEAAVGNVLREYPLIPPAVSTLVLRKARTRTDEGADLYVNDDGQRHAVLALAPARFLRSDELADLLRHEFLHLHDMLDPAFGYSPSLPLPAAHAGLQKLARERYRLLWDITIDGRLAARGHRPSTDLASHAAALAIGFPFWSEEKRLETQDSLWHGPAPGHDHLAALAADPRDVGQSHQPVPGGPCPLCGFSTFDWILPAQIAPTVSAHVTIEFPHWSPDHGMCGRCHEIYQSLAQLPA